MPDNDAAETSESRSPQPAGERLTAAQRIQRLEENYRKLSDRLESSRSDQKNRDQGLDHFAARLAEEFSKVAPVDRPDIPGMQHFDMIRRELAGPWDDEAGNLSPGTLTSFSPAYVKVGGVLTLYLTVTAEPERVAFASAERSGETVTVIPGKNTQSQSAQTGGPGLDVTVPEGAATGKVTVELSDGTFVTSTSDVHIILEEQQ